MVSKQSVERQFKRIRFNHHGWGKAEARELPNILLPEEKIFECVNGIYEGGFALLCATNVRVLLVDKKPLNYLTVEDLRFDMINEIDYSHRLFGARISISAGAKNLQFTSYNQQRLRKLINHVQHCIAETKQKATQHQVGQNQHLEQINQQLQAYLLAQHKQQQEMQQQLERAARTGKPVEFHDKPVQPSPELSDYLFAQTLLQQYKDAQKQGTLQMPSYSQTLPPVAMPQQPQLITQPASMAPPVQQHFQAAIPTPTLQADNPNPQMADLYAEGMQEVFGRRHLQPEQVSSAVPPTVSASTHDQPQNPHVEAVKKGKGASVPFNPLEINPFRIAYSKIPMVLRNRTFGKPSMPIVPSNTVADAATPGQTQIAGAN